MIQLPRPALLLASSAALALFTGCEVFDTALHPYGPPPAHTVASAGTHGGGIGSARETIDWHGFRLEADTILADEGASGRVQVRFPSHFSLRTATADRARLSRTDAGVPALILSGSPALDGQTGSLDLVTGGPGTVITVTSDSRYQVLGPATYGTGTL